MEKKTPDSESQTMGVEVEVGEVSRPGLEACCPLLLSNKKASLIESK